MAPVTPPAVYEEPAHCSGMDADGFYVFSLDGGGMFYADAEDVHRMDVSPEWGTRWIVRFRVGVGPDAHRSVGEGKPFAGYFSAELVGLSLTHCRESASHAGG